VYRLLAASLVVALTNMSSAAAQGDLKQPIGRCGAGEWRVSTEQNPLDDSRTVILIWSSYLGLEQTPVTTRLGTGDAKTQQWPLSTDNQATFYPGNDAAFLEQLLSSDRLVAQTTPYSESPITAVFDLAGLSGAVKPLREVCPAKGQ